MTDPRDFSRLKNGLTGISNRMLTAHLELYENYVTSLNDLSAPVDQQPATTFSRVSEPRRRLPYIYSAVVLHELYFEALGGEGGLPEAGLTAKAEKAFGSVEGYLRDLRLTCGSTNGWALTVYDERRSQLMNVLVEDHRTGNVPDCRVLLAVDCWEHAYTMDYGLDKEAYLGAFFKNVDWSVVEKRLKGA